MKTVNTSQNKTGVGHRDNHEDQIDKVDYMKKNCVNILEMLFKVWSTQFKLTVMNSGNITSVQLHTNKDMQQKCYLK